MTTARETYEYGFHYAGPREPKDDRDCETCKATVTHKCPTHGNIRPGAPTEGCAHCAAAAGTSPCQAHWGLRAALADYAGRLQGDALQDFTTAAAIVMDTSSPLAQVTVNIRGDRGGGVKDGRSFHVEMIPRP